MGLNNPFLSNEMSVKNLDNMILSIVEQLNAMKETLGKTN